MTQQTVPGSKTKTRKKKKTNVFNNAEVDVMVFFPGNAGLNNMLNYMRKIDPRNVPSVHLVAIDGDGPLLKTRFSSPVIRKADSPEEKAKKSNVRRWLSSDRFHVIQLKRDPRKVNPTEKPQEGSGAEAPPAEAVETRSSAFVPSRNKLFGGGGDPVVGREAFQSSIPEIDRFLNRADQVLALGALGGAIGTAGLQIIAEKSKEKGFPAIIVAIIPDEEMEGGEKAANAETARVELRKIANVLPIMNAKFTGDKKITTSRYLEQINDEACLPILEALTEFYQQVGERNTDNSDTRKLQTKGNDLMLGRAEVELVNGQPKAEINVEQILAKVTKPAFQDHNIQAKGILSIWHGPAWFQGDIEEITRGVKTATNCDSTTFIKPQVVEKDDKMWCAFLAAGTFDPAENQGGVRRLNGHKPYKFLENGVAKEVSASLQTQAQIQRWEAELRKAPDQQNKLTVRTLKADFFKQYGFTPDEVLAPQS